MKFVFLLIVLFLPVTVFCQNLQPEVYLFTKDETASMTKFVNNQTLTPADVAACSKLVDNPNIINIEMSDKAKYDITGLSQDLLVIVFRDPATNQIVPVANGGLTSVQIKDESGNSIHTQSLANVAGNYLAIQLANVNGFPQSYSVDKVSILYNGSVNTKDFYFRFLSFISSYGNIIKHSPVGIWFPVGQFGTDFKKTPQGIIFNTLPLGVALGTKFNFSTNFYIGASYSFDYTITKLDDGSGSFSFNSFSHGPVIDFGDYFQIGYNWFANLTSNSVNNRQPFIVVGVGVKVLDLLKNKQSK